MRPKTDPLPAKYGWHPSHLLFIHAKQMGHAVAFRVKGGAAIQAINGAVVILVGAAQIGGHQVP